MLYSQSHSRIYMDVIPGTPDLVEPSACLGSSNWQDGRVGLRRQVKVHLDSITVSSFLIYVCRRGFKSHSCHILFAFHQSAVVPTATAFFFFLKIKFTTTT